MKRSDTDQRLLEEASSALDSACWLLDKRFGSRDWRCDWTIGTTADRLREAIVSADPRTDIETPSPAE